MADRATSKPSSRGAKRAPTGYDRVYAVVRRIPAGKVATYGQVAALAGLPGRARFVGYALHALPDGSVLPWHRVVNAAGKLSLGAISPTGAIEQRIRLEREGVRMVGGRVPLRDFGWRPRGGGRARPARQPGARRASGDHPRR